MREWSRDLYPCIIHFDCVELGKDITAVIKLQDDIKDKGGLPFEGQPIGELESKG